MLHLPLRSLISLFLGGALAGSLCSAADLAPGVRKVRDLVIYEGDRLYSSFPSAVRLPDGDLLVAFRRAPERREFGEKKSFHTDANSYLMMVRSSDGARTWTKEPELLYAHPFGGSQDPGLLRLRDGTLLCTSYGWAQVRPDGIATLKQPVIRAFLDSFVFLGGYLVRSTDGAKSWQGPIYPPHVAEEIAFDPYGEPVPAFNRGAMVEGRDGRIFWVVAVHNSIKPRRVTTHLLVSSDKGLTWQHSAVVADDPKVTFTETSAYETPKGDILAFMRTENFGDEACVARSIDGGKTFQPWQGMGFKGHPLQAMRLPDNRVLLVYGYRHAPFGIRARILNAECTDFSTAPEMVLRDDGGSLDLGYPWSVQLDPKRVLVTYYFNVDNGPRHIAGTILEID